MKTSLFTYLLAASLLLFCPALIADDHGGGDENENDDCQGGHIDGSETLVATVELMGSADAPEGAGGFAKLISENEDGTVQSSLRMVITGLDAGTYTISVVLKSDGSTVDLGQVQIGGCGDGDDEDDGDD